MGSLFEIQTELEVSYNLKYLEKETFEKLYEDTREIERMMSSFISTL
jgi:four helix bundle protein